MNYSKHSPAAYPTLKGVGIRPKCYKESLPTTTNPCFVKSRHYIQPWTERPSYYLDLTQPFIGGRPVRQAHHINAIPRIMRYNTVNLADRNFSCQQPFWGPNCM